VASGGSRKGPGERLDSIDSLRRRVPTIVKRLNDDPALALRAAANPLLVLQEMGIALTERLAAEVELRLRFRPEQVERLQQLRAEIQKHAGEAFDLDDPAQVRRVLFDHLKPSPLPPPAQPVVIAPSQVAKAHNPSRGTSRASVAAPGRGGLTR
jgi:hypothetical protein